MTITPIYAALLGFIFIFLSLRTVRMRGKYKIGIGDGGHPELQRQIRVHGNFAENTPIALILTGMAELQATAGVVLHLLGLMLLLGRILHAYGVSQSKERFIFRQIGMVLTHTVIGLAAFILLYNALLPFF
ncbi:MAG: MAPEG family protein [Alphaproteobacteria bacterium]|nr:MAPEG family protein [Alphaproteobacteria bacterium]